MRHEIRECITQAEAKQLAQPPEAVAVLENEKQRRQENKLRGELHTVKTSEMFTFHLRPLFAEKLVRLAKDKGLLPSRLVEEIVEVYLLQ